MLLNIIFSIKREPIFLNGNFDESEYLKKYGENSAKYKNFVKIMETYKFFKEKRDRNYENYLPLRIYSILEYFGDKTSYKGYPEELDEYIDPYLENGDVEPKLKELNMVHLKDILRDNGQKVSGNKDALIKRCLNNIPHDELNQYPHLPEMYKLSEKGKEFLEENHFYSHYTKYVNMWECDYLSYFLTPNDYMNSFTDVSEDNASQKILDFLNEYHLNGTIEEYILHLFAYAQVYDMEEDFDNLFKTIIKLSLIYMNYDLEDKNFDIIIDMQCSKSSFSDFRSLQSFCAPEYSFQVLSYFSALLDNISLNNLEDYVVSSYNEIIDLVPNLSEKSSIFYLLNFNKIEDKFNFNIKDLKVPEDLEAYYYATNLKKELNYQIEFYHFIFKLKMGFHINLTHYENFLEEGVERGILKIMDPIYSLDNYNANIIRDVLKDYGYNGKNKREDLINFASENLSDDEIIKHFPINDYDLTELAEDYLEKNQHFSLDKELFFKIFSIGSDSEAMISLKEYEENLGSLESLYSYMEENTIKDDLRGNNWKKYLDDLYILSSLGRFVEIDDIKKDQLRYKIFLLRLYKWAVEAEFDSTSLNSDDIYLYRNLEDDTNFINELSESLNVNDMSSVEDETFLFLEKLGNQEIVDALKQLLIKYKNKEFLEVEKSFFEPYWYAMFKSLEEEYGQDEKKLDYIKSDLGLDFSQSEEFNLKIDEFLKEVENLISKGFSREETESKLKHYIDLIDVEWEKELKIEKEKESLERKIMENNFNGRKLEREGKIDEAIELYEDSLKQGFIGDFPYHRLAIIYRKRKDYDNEIRVCEKYINIAKERWGDSAKVVDFEYRMKRAIELKNKN